MISPVFPRFFAFLLLAAAMLAASGCKQSGPPPVVLAQVGDATFTLDELRETFPAEYEKVLPREQYVDVIQRWIDDEAVYQQALKRGLDEDDKMRRKLERLRRRMIIEEFLARETGSTAARSEPDEGAMQRYYDNNKADFVRRVPEYRYLHIRLATLRDALAVRARVRGDNFAALVRAHSLDSSAAMADPPYRKPSETPLCLHDVLDARPGWLSGPLSCPDGVYLVRLLGRVEAGTPLPFHEVRVSIAARLAMQHQERMRETKIRQYKEGVAIRINVDRIPGQEASAPPPMDGDAGEDALPPGE